MKTGNKYENSLPFVCLVVLRRNPQAKEYVIEPVFPVYEPEGPTNSLQHRKAVVLGLAQDFDRTQFVEFVAGVDLLQKINYPDHLDGLRRTNKVLVKDGSALLGSRYEFVEFDEGAKF
jgi:hypothetical protein